MIIERANIQDLQSVYAVLRECGLPAGQIQEHHMEHFLVARSGACVVGVAGLLIAGTDAIGHSLAILPGFRSMGLGRQLALSLHHLALELDMQAIYLFSCSAEFYFRSMGFQVVAHDDVPSPVMDALTELCDPEVVMGGHILWLDSTLAVNRASSPGYGLAIA